MNTIVEVVKAICVGSVVMGAVWLVLPSGNLNKTMRYVLGVVFLLMIITPIFKNLPQFSMPNVSVPTSADVGEDLSSTVTTQVHDVAAASAKKMISDILTAHNISYEEILVEVDISDSYCISISRVDITLKKGEDRDAALKYVKSELGIEDVIVRE